MTVAAPPAPKLAEICCPRCLMGPKPMKRVIVRAAPGSIVEAFCRHCKYREVVIVQGCQDNSGSLLT